VTEILARGAGKSGVKAAIGAAGVVVTAAKAEPATKKAAKPEAVTTAPAEATAGSRPANLLDAPRDGQADDLKKLSGVGPKLEKLLHENGVYHFDQIASWTDAEVEWMDGQLSFKGRITRENWIEQAKVLAAEKE
jgi:large subunit ribosomal protein L21